MAETLAEENKEQKYAYGITPEIREKYRKKLEQMIQEKGIKVAETFEDLLGPEAGQTQEEIQAEVDDFLRMREEWRKEDSDRSFE